MRIHTRNLARKNIQIIAALGLFALALLSAFALLRFPAPVRADETQNIPTEGGTLEAGSYTLSENVTVQSTLQISGNVTIDLGGHALSLEEGQEGSVIQLMSGSLTLKSSSGQGAIKGGNSTTGGGIFVAGTLTLSGNVKITENKGSNIYLSNNNKIVLDNFIGNVGISMGTPGAFTDNEVTNGTFTSDNKGYSVVGKELKIAKLQSVTASYTNTEKVFPTTELEDLKSNVTVTGTNVNNAPYIGDINFTLAVVMPGAPADSLEADETPKTDPTNQLSLGENTVLVTATGEEDETATASVTVTVVKPELKSISVSYTPRGAVYFDTELSALVQSLNVKGLFEDEITRELRYEDSEGEYEEEYINVRYTLEGNLSVHNNGVSTITVSVGEIKETFQVNITEKVAMVGEEVFSDLQKALEQWKPNETLKLYSDQKADTFNVEDKLVLDLNGYTITASHNRAFIISEHGELSVKDDLYSGKIEGGIEVFGSLMLHEGTISKGNYENGGGVYVHSAAVFKMYSGIIKDNKVSEDGGGVYTEGCFEMFGGIIEHNQATNGGGVYIAERGKMSICSAEVRSNSAIGLEYSTYDGYGGGVYVSEGAIIKISKGARIIDNCGMKSIKNNLHLCAERCVEVGSLGEGTEIGITVDYYNTKMPFTFCEKIEGNNSTIEPSAYFKSDRESLIVEYDFGQNCLYCIEG